jgi:hypothetical protein
MDSQREIDAKQLAEEFVRAAFSDWDDASLSVVREVGRQHPETLETRAMNEALEREIERRKEKRLG